MRKSIEDVLRTSFERDLARLIKKIAACPGHDPRR
jgi:hypothetical protein